MFYNFEKNLLPGKFITRLNRFTAEVLFKDTRVLCHVPSSGRMSELLTKGADVLLRPAPLGSSRKTSYDLALVWYNSNWVSVDSKLPNRLLEIAVAKGLVSPLKNATLIKREPSFKKGRFDLLYELFGDKKALIECKSVTLVEKGRGLFPDAPTSRGKRHLEELGKAYKEGYLSFVVFLVQRADASVFSPNWKRDSEFSETLLKISEEGVNVLSYYLIISPKGFKWGGSLPVEFCPQK